MLYKIGIWLYTAWALFVFGIFLAFALPWARFTALWWGERRGLPYLLRYCQFWAKTWAWLIGLRFVVRNRELLDPKQQYVFVPNHTANGDTFVMIAALNHVFTALGKKEVGGMPLMGYLFRRVCVLVDRKDTADRRRSVEELKKRAGYGVSVLLFPEGTFPSQPDVLLLPFHSGAFRVAIELQLPIVPIVLTNARQMFSNNKLPLRPCTITCIYTPPIDTAGMGEADIPLLKEQVYQRIAAMVLEHEPLFNGTRPNPHWTQVPNAVS